MLYGYSRHKSELLRARGKQGLARPWNLRTFTRVITNSLQRVQPSIVASNAHSLFLSRYFGSSQTSRVKSIVAPARIPTRWRCPLRVKSIVASSSIMPAASQIHRRLGLDIARCASNPSSPWNTWRVKPLVNALILARNSEAVCCKPQR